MGFGWAMGAGFGVSTNSILVGVSGPDGILPILVSSSSRTVSFIIAPQVRQMESVGANSRLQTGQFIGLRFGQFYLGFDEREANRGKNIRIYFN